MSGTALGDQQAFPLHLLQGLLLQEDLQPTDKPTFRSDRPKGVGPSGGCCASGFPLAPSRANGCICCIRSRGCFQLHFGGVRYHFRLRRPAPAA